MSQKPKAIGSRSNTITLDIAQRPAVVVPKSYPNGFVIDWHFHRYHQLVCASSGVMAVETENDLWLIPPQRAVWVPAYQKHKVYMYGDAEMKNLYLHQDIDLDLPSESCVLNISAMLREIINHLSESAEQSAQDTFSQPYRNLIQVVLDQLKVAPQASVNIPVPSDKRLVPICEAILQDPSSNQSLKEWSERANVSSRTLSRMFRSDLGMSFIDYRQQARLFSALKLLANNQPVTTVALSCGFSSLSAFNQLFKLNFGVTPGKFFSAPLFTA
ncbi:AraC family transcriptional regulator [Vibrio gigantis]|uniref:AraC family transcriptional regulator n=1 Tax=Vibrio gigantis TaxID=296199 RepID=UPI001BFE6B9C|nr:helix-turn-helix transcriptional regulator [Vibrio gigantis]